MTVLRGSPIFGVHFCDTGVGVACDDMAIKFGLGFFLLFYWTEARVSTQFFHAFLFIYLSSVSVSWWSPSRGPILILFTSLVPFL